MSHRFSSFLVALVSLGLSVRAAADEVKKPANFAQAVVGKAISFAPSEVKTKLSAAEKDILAGAKAVLSPPQSSQELWYFVDKGEGPGPAALAEQFRLVRKGVGENASYSVLAPRLGRLAGSVIALCQPYHSDERAFKSPAHAAFERKLDADSGSLKADFDGYNSVDSPSEFAVSLAKCANESLKKLESAESEGAAGVPSAVFTQAANSVADCWWTLLVKEKSGTSEGAVATSGYIGNKRSLKFHLPTCRWLPAEKNRIYFKTREEAIAEGFVPCKVCRP